MKRHGVEQRQIDIEAAITAHREEDREHHMRTPAFAMAYFYPCAQLVMCGGTFFSFGILDSMNSVRKRVLNAIENYGDRQ